MTEANRWGRPVAAHAHGADGIKAAIRAGVRTVDHGSYLDDEAVALLKASGRKTFYVPTLYTNDAILNGEGAKIPDSEVERARRIREIAFGAFRRALAAGIPIGFATDSSVIPHGKNAHEMTIRVGLGESPMAAIVSADEPQRRDHGLVGPRRVRREGQARRPRRRARATRCKDITEMERVRFVMKDGVVYRNDELGR